LGVAFTTRAARELRARVTALCPAAGPATIGTLHSFGLRLLRRWADRLGYHPGHLAVIDREDELGLVADILADLGLDAGAWPPEAVLREVGAWKREGGWLEEPDEPFEAVVRGVVAACRRRNLVDFDDLVALPLGLLLEYPDALAWARGRFSTIVAD